MIYLWLKYIHILSSTILFGTGIGTACVMLYGHYRKNINAMAVITQYVVHFDWLFTGTSALMQLTTGLLMVYLSGLSLLTPWVLGGLIGYGITGVCWLIVVYLQIKIKNSSVTAAHEGTPLSSDYYRYFKWWFILGWPAFLSLMGVFYLMVMKPQLE
jgi:uncharacterized membrane protein